MKPLSSQPCAVGGKRMFLCQNRNPTADIWFEHIPWQSKCHVLPLHQSANLLNLNTSNTFHKSYRKHALSIFSSNYKTLWFFVKFPRQKHAYRLNALFISSDKLNNYHAPPQFHIRNILPAYARIIVPNPMSDALSLFPSTKDRMHKHIKMSKNVMKYLNHISVS